jgi:hypothetical protein
MKIRALVPALALAAVAILPGAARAEVLATTGYPGYGYGAPPPPLCIDRFGYVVPPHFCAPRGYWQHGRQYFGPPPGYVVRYPHHRPWRGHHERGHGGRGHRHF